MSRSTQTNLPQNTITDYRQIDRLSYSALKMFYEDRKKFKTLFIDKDEEAIKKHKEELDKSDYIRMGNIVDVILTDTDNFYKYFVITKATKPSGQMLTLVDFLYEFTLKDTENGVVSSTFEERFEKAYEALKESNGGKLQSKLETFAGRFEAEGLPYFKEKLDSIGKTIITTDEDVIAQAIVESLKTSIGTKELVNAEGLTKYPILFDVGDIPMKMEADKIIFDHENKTISLFDYKITSFVESFIWDGFLKKSYYIQAALYRFGLEQWKETTEFKDYKVENMKFIVADQKNYYAPLVYETTDDHYQQGWLGFKVGNKYYKGINTLLENYKFALKENRWNISEENYSNKGKVFIPLFKNLEE